MHQWYYLVLAKSVQTFLIERQKIRKTVRKPIDQIKIMSQLDDKFYKFFIFVTLS